VVACTPHPGLGTVVVRHFEVDLATCKTTPAKRAPSRVGPVANGKTIVFHGKVVVRATQPLEAEGTSPDGRWILYAIDPLGSASIAADGVTLKAIRVTGGRSYTVASGLLYGDYRAWCGGTLVMTAGGDRISTHNKWLITTGPPYWRPRVIVKDAHVAFGSLACDGNGVVVQSAPAGGVNDNVHARWSIWRVGFDGSRTRLTSPPRGASDESPQVAGSTVYFVRRGWLYALHVGRLLKLPPTTGYYGHTAWPYSVRR
jgi:hypothetical protein